MEAVEVDKGKVKLASKTVARRTILEVAGKMKGETGADQLVQAMRQTLARNAEKARLREATAALR